MKPTVALSFLLCLSCVRVGETCPAGSDVTTCISTINTAAHGLNRTFFPDSFNLSVYVNVTFNAPKEEFEVCCKTFTFPAKKFSLDPLNPDEKAAHTKTENDPQITFEGAPVTGMHTLLMVDPDVPFATVGNKERPFVHMLAINIPDGDISQGHIITGYNGPMPPDNLPHNYFYMLFKQSGSVDNNTIPQYSNGGDVNCGVPGRCLFDAKQFATDNNMSLVGLSWMRVSNDIFVNYRYMQRGSQTEAQVCANEPTYKNPCPTGAAVRVWSLSWAFITLSGLILLWQNL